MLEYDVGMSAQDLSGMWGSCVIPYQNDSGEFVLSTIMEVDKYKKVHLVSYLLDEYGHRSMVAVVDFADFFKKCMLHIPPPSFVVRGEDLFWVSSGPPTTGPARGIVRGGVSFFKMLKRQDNGYFSKQRSEGSSGSDLALKLLLKAINTRDINPSHTITMLLDNPKARVGLLDRTVALARYRQGSNFNIFFGTTKGGTMSIKKGVASVSSDIDGISNEAILGVLQPLLKQHRGLAVRAGDTENGTE